jgi:lysophospholipase L1-like esterase
MKKKQWIALGVALSMLAATGCAGGSSSETTTTTAAETIIQDTTAETTTEAPTEATPQDQEYSPITDHVKLLGRTYENNDTLWMAYSGSGVEFEVTGKALSIILYGDSSAIDPKTDDGCARYAIYVDGERVIDEMMNQAAKNITIFEGDEERTATVRFVKLSETANSVMGIREIDVKEGEISPTPEKERYIEFVGDSITCGYGVDDEDRNNHFSTTTEDVTKTYAYKTAQALDADYSMVSISGYGIISGYTSNGTKQENQVMGKYYDKLGFSYTNTGAFNVADIDWGFEREPDVIVINLGTNDSSYVGSDAEREQEYLDGYVEFLKQVREKNPDAYILCTLGLMGDSLYSTVEDAVAAYSEETGDENLAAFHFDPIQSDEGYAADWHPTEATHTRAAEALTERLQELF